MQMRRLIQPALLILLPVLLVVLLIGIMARASAPDGPMAECLKNTPDGMEAQFRLPNQCVYVEETRAIRQEVTRQ